MQCCEGIFQWYMYHWSFDLSSRFLTDVLVIGNVPSSAALIEEKIISKTTRISNAYFCFLNSLLKPYLSSVFISTSRSEYAPGASAIIDPSEVTEEDWWLPAAEKMTSFFTRWSEYHIPLKRKFRKCGLNNTFQIKYGRSLHRLPSFKKIATFCSPNHR